MSYKNNAAQEQQHCSHRGVAWPGHAMELVKVGRRVENRHTPPLAPLLYCQVAAFKIIFHSLEIIANHRSLLIPALSLWQEIRKF